MAQQSSPDVSLVLVVDENGYRVLTARTGLEAVEQLEHNSEISVLFTDIRMPDIAGEGLAGIATTWRPYIRVVLTSAFGRPHGDSEFLPKPYRAADLIRVFPPQPLPTLESDSEASRSD
jgi:CheY-like chemotaxis protein